MARGMQKQIVLSEEDYASYKDASDCFGNTTPKAGYDPNESECVRCRKDNGDDFANKCKALCEGVEGILEGEFEAEEPSNPVREETPVKEDVKAEVTETVTVRECVSYAVTETLIGLSFKPEVVESATRSKVHVGDRHVFTITERGLKIEGIEDGKVLGLTAKQWKADNKGITIAYDTTINFAVVVEKAMETLFEIDTTPAPKEEPKKDLFETETVAPKNVPASSSTVVVKEPIKPMPLSGEQEEVVPVMEAPDAFKGEVVKKLEIIKYTNHYTEVRITVKTESASELLAKLRQDFA